MKERARNLLVGAMSIAGLVGLALILLLFGYVPEFFEPGYFVTFHLDQAAGLTEGSPVKYKDVTIGQIRDVDLHQDRVVMLAKITYENNDEAIGIPREVQIRVDAPFIGGNASLVLSDAHLDPKQRRELLPQDGSAVLSAEVRTGGGGFASELRDMLTEPLKRFETLSNEWTQVATNLNTLIEPRTPEEVDGGQGAGNLTTMLARADARLAEMRAVLDNANKWLGDEALRQDVKSAVANVRDTSENLKQGTDEMRALMGDAGQQMDRLTKRYIAVADDLSATIRSVQATIDKANEGEGTIGKLLNDPSVYDNLNDALERVDAAVKDLQLLIEKWKKEGVPVRL